MSWYLQTSQLSDEYGNFYDKWRLTIQRGEYTDRFPFGNKKCFHNSPEEAENCRECHDYILRLTGRSVSELPRLITQKHHEVQHNKFKCKKIHSENIGRFCVEALGNKITITENTKNMTVKDLENMILEHDIIVELSLNKEGKLVFVIYHGESGIRVTLFDVESEIDEYLREEWSKYDLERFASELELLAKKIGTVVKNRSEENPDWAETKYSFWNKMMKNS